MQNVTASSKPSKIKTILFAWFIAGTLDMVGALLVYVVILKKVSAEKIVRGIARGIFKNDAMSGGSEMIFYGVAFHYLIALLFTIFFFLIFPYIPFFRKQKILGGLLYGLFVWAVMNLIVLRIVFPNPAPITFKGAWIGASILMVMIGLPLSYFANRYYANKNSLRR